MIKIVIVIIVNTYHLSWNICWIC